MLLQVFHPNPPSGTTTLFPNEHGGGAFFSNEETVAFTRKIAAVYVSLTVELGKAIEQELALPQDTGQPIARRAVIPLTHCYTDRLLRLHRLLRNTHIDEIGRSAAYTLPAHCEQFDSLASNSFAFNQDVAGKVGKLLGVPLSNIVVTDPFLNQLKMPVAFANHLFFFAASNKLRRGWQRFQLARSRRSGRVIATWMVNTKVPMLEAGLYGRGLLAHMEDSWQFVEPDRDFSLRQKIVQRALTSQLPLYREFLASCGIDDVALLGHASAGLVDFFVEFLPPTLLEGAQANLDLGVRALARYPRSKAVYSCGLAQTTQAAFLIAAARVAGKKVIGTQHGGHYGYMEAHTAGVDVEYPDCDEYVTWGWDQFPDHPALERPHIVPLPAPWYSHRRSQWRSLLTEAERLGTNKEFDFAFMPNKVYPYVPAPSAAHASINHVAQVGNLLREVVTACAARRRSILLKLYGMDSQRLLASALSDMHQTAGPLLQMNENLDKGITAALVRRCRMFLWDQPGTGFIECLHAQIPALVYWPRLYNREDSAAEPIFECLESAGLVHRSILTLLDAYDNFSRNPDEWMNDPARVAAGARFVRQYGWAEDDWPRHWQSYLHAQGNI